MGCCGGRLRAPSRAEFTVKLPIEQDTRADQNACKAFIPMARVGDASMCNLCYQGMLQNHFNSRRNFLKGAAAAGVAAAGLNLFASRPAAAELATPTEPPRGTGTPGRR